MNKENNTKKQWLPLWISVSIFAGMVIGFSMRDQFPSSPFFSFEKKSILGEIETLIKKRYVDEVDMKSINDTVIQTMLSKLDPHSVHIPATELEEVNDDIHGQFVGVGIEYMLIQDTTHVVRLMPDGPAEKAGIEVGDRILKADEKSLIGIDEDSIRGRIKGAENSMVTLTIMRDGIIKKIKIKRSRISVNSVDASYMMNDEVGYIRLSQFTTETYREFMESLTELKNKGMKKLIFDLRGNTGGVLDEAVEIADEFLSGDKLITYTEGKHQPKKEYRCKREGQFENGELILLSDGESASASEILLGAMQDWDRATIIGSKSFGKGLVQEQYDLSDKSALRLTIARYFTPVGRCIQRSYANGKEAYYSDQQKNDTLKGKVYLSSKGKKLYDSGGISPDEPIAADSLIPQANKWLFEKDIKIGEISYLLYTSENSSKGKSNGFSVDWINKLPKTISASFSTCKPETLQIISHFVEAETSRIQGGQENYFKTLNQYDPVVKAALMKMKQ